MIRLFSILFAFCEDWFTFRSRKGIFVNASDKRLYSEDRQELENEAKMLASTDS